MFLTDFWVIRYNIVSNSGLMYVIIRKRFKKDKSREEEGGIVLCCEFKFSER